MKLIKPIALLISLTLLPQTVFAEVKHVSEYGFIIENKIETLKSIDVTWQVLTSEIDQWWPKDHSWWEGTFSIQANAGGCFCETSGERTAEHMRIVFVDPGKVLRMTGGLGPLQGMGLYGALDWHLSRTEDGKTQVVLSYAVHGVSADGFEQLAPIVDKVQGIQLSGLNSFFNQLTRRHWES